MLERLEAPHRLRALLLLHVKHPLEARDRVGFFGEQRGLRILVRPPNRLLFVVVRRIQCDLKKFVSSNRCDLKLLSLASCYSSTFRQDMSG